MTIPKPSKVDWTVSRLKRESKKLRFDLAIQRNEVWTDEQKSLFVHSLIFGYPFPPVYAIKDEKNVYWFLDGKQRITTTLRFVNDGFMLTQNTPPIVEEVDGEEVSTSIAGKIFSELPKEYQDQIMETSFDIFNMTGITDEQRDEMFRRLNNGSALRNVEITRVIASSKVMEFIKEIVAMPFFQTSVNISEKSRNRFVDEEMLLQIILLIEANKSTLDQNEFVYVSCNGPDIRKFAEELRENDIPSDTKEIVKNVTEYLCLAFPVYEKRLKKVHVPMVFMMAMKFAIPSEVSPLKFSGWVTEFFGRLNAGSPYNNASRAGSAKKENIEKRLISMRSDYLDHIRTAKDYVIPESDQSNVTVNGQSDGQSDEEESALQRVLGVQDKPMFDDEGDITSNQDQDKTGNLVV